MEWSEEDLLKLEEEWRVADSYRPWRLQKRLNWCFTGSCGWSAAPPSLWPQLSWRLCFSVVATAAEVATCSPH